MTEEKAKLPDTNKRERPYPEMNPGPGIWLVLWHGRVHRHADPRHYADLKLEVFLVQVSEKQLAAVPSPKIIREQNERCRLIKTSIGKLPKMPIGSLWENGLRIGVVPGRELNFPTVSLGPNVDHVSLGIRAHNRAIAVPLFSEYHVFTPVAMLGSQLFRMQLPSGETAYIPATEVIRYFFGVSSTFLQRLFMGGLDIPRNLFEPESLQIDENRIATIAIHKGLNAEVVGKICARIAADPERLLASALSVNRSLHGLLDKYDEEETAAPQPFPVCKFPVIDPTSVKLRGRWVKLQAAQSSWAFLVHEILEFETSIPFDEVEVILIGAPGRGEEHTPNGETYSGPQTTPVRDGSESDSAIVNDGSANGSLAPLDFEDEDFGSKFTNPKDIRVKRSKKLHSEAEGRPRPPTKTIEGALSISPTGMGSEGMARIRISQRNTDEDKPRSNDPLLDLAGKRTLSKFVTLVQIIEAGGVYQISPALTAPLPNDPSGGYTASSDRASMPPEFYAARISHYARHFYLIHTPQSEDPIKKSNGRMALVWRDSFDEFSPAALEQLFANYHGNWKTACSAVYGTKHRPFFDQNQTFAKKAPSRPIDDSEWARHHAGKVIKAIIDAYRGKLG